MNVRTTVVATGSAVALGCGAIYLAATPGAGMAWIAFAAFLVLAGLAWRYVIGKRESEARLERLVQSRTRRLTDSIAETEEFSQALAHDVRGPMINIREFLEIVLSEHGGELSEETRDYLERAVRATKRIDRLTSAMLEYGELARRRFKLQRVRVEPVARAVAEEMRKAWPDAQITLVAPFPDVWGDPGGLADVLRELLANACRFSRPGSSARVVVSSVERGRGVRLLVHDEGIGVKIQFQQRIFRPFEQLVRVQDHPGIGLALAKRAVIKMNGRIGVYSDGSTGSQFWIELPTADAGERHGDIPFENANGHTEPQ